MSLRKSKKAECFEHLAFFVKTLVINKLKY